MHFAIEECSPPATFHGACHFDPDACRAGAAFVLHEPAAPRLTNDWLTGGIAIVQEGQTTAEVNEALRRWLGIAHQESMTDEEFWNAFGCGTKPGKKNSARRSRHQTPSAASISLLELNRPGNGSTLTWRAALVFSSCELIQFCRRSLNWRIVARKTLCTRPACRARSGFACCAQKGSSTAWSVVGPA